MVGNGVSFEKRHIDDFEKAAALGRSTKDTLNAGYYDSFYSNGVRQDSPGSFYDEEIPVDEAVTTSVAVRVGPDDDVVEVSTFDLDCGDIILVETPDKNLRLKVYGPVYHRPEESNVTNELKVTYSLDVWRPEAEQWEEVQRRSGTNQGEIEEELGETTLRLFLMEAPGLHPEADFEDLIGSGLSPAEALDYWMVEFRKNTQDEWAETRGRTQQAISKNIAAARDKLAE